MVRFVMAGGRVSLADSTRWPSLTCRLKPAVPGVICLIALAVSLSAAMPASAAPTAWVAPSYERVKQDAAAGTATEISLYAAQGEWESFQVLVAGSATNVRITPPAGVPVTVKLYREHYVPVTHVSTSTQANRPEGPGLYPDALIPFDAPGGAIAKAQPYTVASGKVQPYWVDVFVPRMCAPGQYILAFVVSSDQGSTTVTARLTVWAFQLPEKPALQTAFALWPPLRGQLQPELLLLENRIQPTFTEATHSATLAAAGQSASHVGFWASLDKSNCTIATSKPTAAQVDSAIARYAPLAPYAYIADEVYTSCDSSTPLENWTEALRGKVKTMVTIAPRAGWEWLDIFVTLPKFDVAADVAAAQARGSEVWSYNCLAQDGYSPKWLLDYAPINYRIQPGFLNWRRGLTGLLYWRVDYWSGGSGNPWTSGEVYSSASYPGEGLLVYPGANIGMPAGAVAPSMRLKYLRDGVDDFDYLTLLAAQGQGDWARGVVASIATDWHTWSRDPVALDAARRQLGERLSSLSSPVHTFTVSASVSPTTVASSGSASLNATATDSSGHSVSSWSWSDGGAGGIFTPSTSVQNPTYIAAANTTGSNRIVTLMVTAICSGSTTLSDSGSMTLTVQSVAHTLTVSAGASPATVASGGAASLSASASDSLGHMIATWSWSDDGAGGSFSPSPSMQNPTYTAPVNTTDAARQVTATVTATCAGAPAISRSASASITVNPVAHTLSVAASAVPTTVGSAGSTSLSASAADSRGDAVIGWQWNDGGTGGSFIPSPNVSNPTYIAAENTTGADRVVSLTVMAVCDGSTPLSDSAAVPVTVQSVALTLPVDASTPIPSVVLSEATTSLAATTSDSVVDQTANWRWDDGGANGAFLPSATVRNPQYRAPRNSTGHDMRVVLTVIASCGDPIPVSGADSTSVTVEPAPHTLSVSAAAQRPVVSWKGRTELLATANDNDGHSIASWLWSDSGAGGAFSPSARVQNPTYRVPTSVSAGAIILSVTATCDGPSPLTATGFLSLAVETKRGSKTVVYRGLRVTRGQGSEDPITIIRDVADSPFSDLTADFWAKGAIKACQDTGILTGFPDGTYRPDIAVSRDQVAVYIARAVAGSDKLVPPGPIEASFRDVPAGHWAYRYVEYVKAMNIVTGFSDGSYRPADEVNRAEMSAFVARSIALPTGDEGLRSYQPPANPTFSDLPADHWAFKYVEYLVEQRIAGGYPDSTFQPGNVCTRAEMAVYLARGFGLGA